MKKYSIKFGIGGAEISHFNSIELHQTINNHHRFSVSVPHTVIEKPRAYTIQNAQDWLGKVANISLESGNEFLGVITNIEFAQEEGHVGNQIIVSGFSKTILLESGEKMASWNDLSLKEIIEDVIKKSTADKLQNSILPKFKSELKYLCQYLETDFQFMQRLAKQYNEWFFYDGEKLHFGKPSSLGEITTLSYNQDVSKLNIGIQAVPNKFSGFTYDEMGDQNYEAKSSDSVSELSKLGDDAFDVSKKIFNTPAYTYSPVSSGNEAALENLLKDKQAAAVSSTNFITATSKNINLRVGKQILLKANVLDGRIFNSEDIGLFIITEITHYATNLSEYENNFRAIPLSHFIPEPDVAFPVAQIQQATVKDNADPKNKGRVRVQMLWQKGNQMTDWLRVMTPDAGSSDKVGSNRGMVFIPEKGDQVMLGFRYNDPNRPFVLGSVFHGKSAGGGGSDNNKKSLTTRGGSTVTLDEEKNTVTVSDPSGNVITLNGDGTITISAPNKIDINSKEININAEEKVNINGINEVNVESKKATINGTDEVTIKSDTKITDEAPAIAIKGETSIKAEAPTIDIDGATMTNVKGGMVNLN